MMNMRQEKGVRSQKTGPFKNRFVRSGMLETVHALIYDRWDRTLRPDNLQIFFKKAKPASAKDPQRGNACRAIFERLLRPRIGVPGREHGGSSFENSSMYDRTSALLPQRACKEAP